MPLPENPHRKALHTRQVTCRGYQRDDGLWEIDGHLVDTKTYSIENRWRGDMKPGDQIHGMWLRLVIDNQLVVHDCIAISDYNPFPCCDEITPLFKRLIGEKIGPGWNRRVKELVGGVQGCTHLTDLVAPVTTTAFQTMGDFSKQEGGKIEEKPFYIDGCHALDSSGPIVQEFHPMFFKEKVSK